MGHFVRDVDGSLEFTVQCAATSKKPEVLQGAEHRVAATRDVHGDRVQEGRSLSSKSHSTLEGAAAAVVLHIAPLQSLRILLRDLENGLESTTTPLVSEKGLEINLGSSSQRYGKLRNKGKNPCRALKRIGGGPKSHVRPRGAAAGNGLMGGATEWQERHFCLLANRMIREARIPGCEAENQLCLSQRWLTVYATVTSSSISVGPFHVDVWERGVTPSID